MFMEAPACVIVSLSDVGCLPNLFYQSLGHTKLLGCFLATTILKSPKSNQLILYDTILSKK